VSLNGCLLDDSTRRHIKTTRSSRSCIVPCFEVVDICSRKCNVLAFVQTNSTVAMHIFRYWFGMCLVSPITAQASVRVSIGQFNFWFKKSYVRSVHKNEWVNCTKLLHVSAAETKVNCMYYLNEAYFHRDWVLDKQNMCLWAMSNPQICPEKVCCAPTITLWAVISSCELLVFLVTKLCSLIGSWAWCITVYASACCYWLAQKHWFVQVHTTHSFFHNAFCSVYDLVIILITLHVIGLGHWIALKLTIVNYLFGDLWWKNCFQNN
jgi:hypothetical protein